MTAVTESGRTDHNFGDLRVVVARLVITNGYTWDPGLSAIVWVGITDRAASASEDIGCTWSGGTVTFAVESGTPTAEVIALGY